MVDDVAKIKSKRLTALLEVSQALGSTLDTRAAVEKVLEILDRELGMKRGAIALLEGEGDLKIQYAYGLSEGERQRGRYKVDEGVTGKVVASGRPIVVPQVSKEPLFLYRTRKRSPDKEESFICVPIKDRRKTVGALSITYPYKQNRNYEDSVQLLTIVTSMIAQGLRLGQLVEQERAQLQDENALLKRELQQKYDFRNIVGTSKEMRDVYEQIAQVAPSGATVLIRGESGTGKELVAHAIHYNSPRSSKPFVKVNCAALPESLIESELFGHEKGAFTGAVARKRGRFELAEGGTLFLDEIGELELGLQAKLLRVLEEGSFRRVGGLKDLPLDVRVVAASNRDLKAESEAGRFRLDLYFRLSVIQIDLPSLRERGDDVLLLAKYYLAHFNERLRKRIRGLTSEVEEIFRRYSWPGNVRELRNVIERVTILEDSDLITASWLPRGLIRDERTVSPPPVVAESQAAEVGALSFQLPDEGINLEQVELSLVRQAMERSGGNQTRAAELLGVSRDQLRYRLKKIEEPQPE